VPNWKIATACPGLPHRVILMPVSYLKTVTFVPSRKPPSRGVSPSMATKWRQVLRTLAFSGPNGLERQDGLEPSGLLIHRRRSRPTPPMYGVMPLRISRRPRWSHPVPACAPSCREFRRRSVGNDNVLLAPPPLPRNASVALLPSMPPCGIVPLPGERASQLVSIWEPLTHIPKVADDMHKGRRRRGPDPRCLLPKQR
jgi:hypothetical protein